jgi:uncharacterized protein (DUF2062 family)
MNHSYIDVATDNLPEPMLQPVFLPKVRSEDRMPQNVDLSLHPKRKLELSLNDQKNRIERWNATHEVLLQVAIKLKKKIFFSFVSAFGCVLVIATCICNMILVTQVQKSLKTISKSTFEEVLGDLTGTFIFMCFMMNIWTMSYQMMALLLKTFHLVKTCRKYFRVSADLRSLKCDLSAIDFAQNLISSGSTDDIIHRELCLKQQVALTKMVENDIYKTGLK